ncbi:MAG: hypothetical protein MZV63_03475 [Marinilabiliales bacterium]|nr:hypothetical protein [Marinilabiliales bacterium]
MGDPAGIGPEIAAKAFADKALYGKCRPAGGRRRLGDGTGGEDRRMSTWASARSIPVSQAKKFEHGVIDVIDLKDAWNWKSWHSRKVSAMGGRRPSTQ